LLSTTFAAATAESSAALTTRSRSVLTGNRRDHEDRGHRRSSGQSRQGTQETVVLLHVQSPLT